MILNKKDVMRINQEIGESGVFQNESSLDYALSTAKQNKTWLYETSQILRSLLVDHAFIDGNKRTALAVLLTYLEDKDLEYDKQKIVLIIYQIAKKNVNNSNDIMRMIKNGLV